MNSGGSCDAQPACDAIRQALDSFVDAWNRRDADAAADIYTDPHYDLNATPQFETRAQTAEKFRRIFEARPSRIEVTSDEILLFGDYAIQRGEFELTFEAGAHDEPTSERRSYIELLKRSPDGRWRVHWGIDGPVGAGPDDASTDD